MTGTDRDVAQLWSTRFRRERVASWQELDKLVGVIERRGIRDVPAEALARLPALYRAALSSLSVARAVCLDRNLLVYLEALTARAHLCVYGPRESILAGLIRFVRDRLPTAIRAAALPLLLAFLALALGFGIAFALCSEDLDTYYFYFVDAGRASGREPGATTAELRETLFDQGDHSDGSLATFAAVLWNHNSRVTLLAFGLAILGGVPGLLLVLITGFELGAMSALFHSHELAVEWWSWILPHGITELFAVLVGTAAGLRLAGGLLFPGQLGRLRAMTQRSHEAGPLMLGAIGMLFLAGQIEGVFRQTVQDVPVRYALAAVTALLWTIYCLFCGRRPR